MSGRSHLVSAAISLVAVAYFVLGACVLPSPTAGLRPVTPMGPRDDTSAAKRRSEIGIGVGSGKAIAIPGDGPGSRWSGEILGQGMFWGTYRISDEFDIGGTLFGGSPSTVGGGLLMRYIPIQTEHFNMGIKLEGGWIWGFFGLDFAFKLHERVWAFLNPAVGWGYPPLVVPVGFAFKLTELMQLVAEFDYGNFLYLGSHLHTFGGALAALFRF